MPPKQTQTRTILIKTSGEGSAELKKIAQDLGLLNKSVKSLQGSMRSLSTAFQSVFAASVFGMGIREVIGMSDSMQQLRDRIGVVSGGAANVGEIFGSLQEAANRSRVSVDSMASAFVRFTAATSESGLQASTMMEVTENLQKTFLIMGSTTEEASSMALQLSQSMASGRVQGDEFRSMMESNSYYTALLAKQMGVTRGELKQLSKEGKITAKDAMLALSKNTQMITEDFEKLRITAGQGATVAMNNLKGAVDQLNESIGLSSKIGKSLIFLSENFSAISATIIAIATYAIPLLIGQTITLNGVWQMIKSINPELLAISATIWGLVYVLSNLGRMSAVFTYIKSYLLELGADALEVIANMYDGITKLLGLGERTQSSREFIKGLRVSAEDAFYMAEALDIANKEALKMGQSSISATDDISKNMKTAASAAEKAKEMLAALNKAYLSGKISAREYFDTMNATKLKMLNKEFSDGKKELIAYLTELDSLKRNDLTQRFNQGGISLKYYGEELNNIAASTAWNKFNAGSISLMQLNKELSELHGQLGTLDSLTVGVGQYVESLGSYSNAVVNATAVTLRAAEDEMVTYLTTGKATWQDFTDTVLKQIARIVIQMVVMKPIIDAFMNSLYGGPVGSIDIGGRGGSMVAMSEHAKGGVFNQSGITAFASGGVVNSPTMFGYGRGKTGLMGEAGPEAIMPLRRTKGGDLGVQATTAPVYVNIVNNSGAEVTQTESTGPNGERNIEVMIHGIVNKGMATGQYDRAMVSNYNTRRKGSS